MQFQSNPSLFLYLIALFYVSVSVIHEPYYIVALYFCSAWIAKETICRVVQDSSDFTLLTGSHTNDFNTHHKTLKESQQNYNIFYICDLEYRREAREVCRADRTHRGGVCLFTPWYANEYCGENTSMRTFVPCGEKQV